MEWGATEGRGASGLCGTRGEGSPGKITKALREQGQGDHRGAEEPGRGITEGNRREISGGLQERGGGGPGAQRRPRGRVWAERPFRPRGRPALRSPLAAPRPAPPLIGPARPPSPFPNMEVLTGPYQARQGVGGAARGLGAATRLRAAGGRAAGRQPPATPPHSRRSGRCRASRKR